MFETSMSGIMVYDLTADSVLYAHNHKQRLRPASTMKLVTAITALDRLGGAHLFKTSLMYKGEVADSTLRGDIYCVGGFDPRLNVDDMHAFVESMLAMGIDTIRGRIIIDKTMKDSDMLGIEIVAVFHHLHQDLIHGVATHADCFGIAGHAPLTAHHLEYDSLITQSLQKSVEEVILARQ